MNPTLSGRSIARSRHPHMYRCGRAPGPMALALTALTLIGIVQGLATAEEAADEAPGYIPLVDGKPYLHVLHEGTSIKVMRIQDPNFELKGYYARTARKCPPFCLHPMEAAPGVKTIGEVEMFAFMEGELRNGDAVLIDARTPPWYKKGTIPGAVNIPFTDLSLDPDDPQWASIMEGFGATPRGEVGKVERTLEDLGLVDAGQKTDRWDFTKAKKLVLFCNGPACDQSSRAITGLRTMGYPAEKLFYYRGGMQMWEIWGLTTVVPKQ